MITTPNIPTLDSPALLDRVLADINTVLSSGLSWLDNTFGKAQRIEIERGNEQLVIPVIYTGGRRNDDYLNMLPDGHIGNYTFFDIEDGQQVDWEQYRQTWFDVNFGLVFWFDFRAVYPNNFTTRSIENVKYDVLRVLNTATFTRTGVKIETMYERSENIYRGYDHNEIDKQFLMRPYGGFRLEGTLRFQEKCPI